MPAASESASWESPRPTRRERTRAPSFLRAECLAGLRALRGTPWMLARRILSDHARSDTTAVIRAQTLQENYRARLAHTRLAGSGTGRPWVTTLFCEPAPLGSSASDEWHHWEGVSTFHRGAPPARFLGNLSPERFRYVLKPPRSPATGASAVFVQLRRDLAEGEFSRPQGVHPNERRLLGRVQFKPHAV